MKSRISWPLACALALGGLSACDEKIEARNHPPTVTAKALCEVDGQAYFVVDVIDLQAEPVDVLVEVEGQRAAPGGGGDGLFGLISSQSAPGMRHWIEWAVEPSACDYSFPDLAGTAGCAPRPANIPTRVTGRLVFSDREVQADADFDLTLDEGCDALE